MSKQRLLDALVRSFASERTEVLIELWAERVRFFGRFGTKFAEARYCVLASLPSASRSIVCTDETGQMDAYNSMLASPDGLHLFVRVDPL